MVPVIYASIQIIRKESERMKLQMQFFDIELNGVLYNRLDRCVEERKPRVLKIFQMKPLHRLKLGLWSASWQGDTIDGGIITPLLYRSY